jgi:Right handed beta helix region
MASPARARPVEPGNVVPITRPTDPDQATQRWPTAGPQPAEPPGGKLANRRPSAPRMGVLIAAVGITALVAASAGRMLAPRTSIATPPPPREVAPLQPASAAPPSPPEEAGPRARQTPRADGSSPAAEPSPHPDPPSGRAPVATGTAPPATTTHPTRRPPPPPPAETRFTFPEPGATVSGHSLLATGVVGRRTGGVTLLCLVRNDAGNYWPYHTAVTPDGKWSAGVGLGPVQIPRPYPFTLILATATADAVSRMDQQTTDESGIGAKLPTGVTPLAQVQILRAANAAGETPSPTPSVLDGTVTPGVHIPSGTFTFAAPVTAGCTRHIATTGNDANDGITLATAWRTPGKAIATLRAGQTGCLHAGTYDVRTLDPAHAGTPAEPIRLVGAPEERRPVLRAASDGPLVNFGPRDAYWILQGLDLDKNQHDGATVQILGNPASPADPTAGPAHHIAIRTNLIHGGKGSAAVLIRHSATDVLIQGNEIYQQHRWISGSTIAYSRTDPHYLRADADALNLEATAAGQVARIQIQGNNLHDNGGDGIQCIGVHDDAGPHSHDPTDLDAVDNRIDHNAENAVDIKSCQRVSIRGSRSPESTGPAAANKFFGYRPTDRNTNLPGNHSDGTAVVVHYFARHVLIENTRIWDSCGGIGLGRQDKNGVQDVIIRRTLIFNLVTGAGCRGIALNLVLAQQVQVYHNTFTDIPGTALRLASDNAGPRASHDVDVFDNIGETTGAGYWFDVYRRRLIGFHSDHNLFWNADGSTSHLLLDFSRTTLSNWQSVTGQDGASLHGDPRWIDQPTLNDYYTKDGSPARDAALRVAAESFCGHAPDIGFRESGC